MPRREPEDQEEDLFPVEAIPTATGGRNLAALDAAIKAATEAGRIVDVDEGAVEAARSGAIALDHALRSKQPAYAMAAVLKPYHELLIALGLGGRPPLAAGATAGDPAADAAKLLEVFGRGPELPS